MVRKTGPWRCLSRQPPRVRSSGVVCARSPERTAPGQCVEHGDRICAAAGPPRELEPMLNALCEGLLGKRAAADRCTERAFSFCWPDRVPRRRGCPPELLPAVAERSRADRDHDSRNAGVRSSSICRCAHRMAPPPGAPPARKPPTRSSGRTSVRMSSASTGAAGWRSWSGRCCARAA